MVDLSLIYYDIYNTGKNNLCENSFQHKIFPAKTIGNENNFHFLQINENILRFVERIFAPHLPNHLTRAKKPSEFARAAPPEPHKTSIRTPKNTPCMTIRPLLHFKKLRSLSFSRNENKGLSLYFHGPSFARRKKAPAVDTAGARPVASGPFIPEPRW